MQIQFFLDVETDLSKRGEDVDLLVISDDYKKRIKILVDLQLALGDRKIDLIVIDYLEKTEYTKMAYKYGVEI